MLLDAILFATVCMIAGTIFTTTCWLAILAINKLDS